MPTATTPTTRSRRVTSQLALVALCATLLVAVTDRSADASPARESRLAGDSRVETSVEIAFNSGLRRHRIYLANAFTSADALAAGAFADGPVLLVPGCGDAPESVRTFINNSFESPVVTALGGTSAICEQMLQSAAGDEETDRIAGADRFATAAAIALRAFPNGADEVYLASAFSSPDPVAGGVLRDGPMLLVRGDGAVPQVVLDAIAELDPDRVVALGGTAAVSAGVLDEAAEGRQQDRLAGANRFATAVEISRYLWGVVPGMRQTSQPLPARKVYLARSDVYADALAAGVVTDGPILLVPSCGSPPQAVVDELLRLRPEEIVALGGRSAVCDQMLREAARIEPTDGRVYFSFWRTQFVDGAIYASNEIVPMAGATVQHGTQTGVTDAAGQIIFDLEPGQEFTGKDIVITNAPTGFRNLSDQAMCNRGYDAGGHLCNINLRSISVSTSPDRGPQGEDLPIWRDQTIRLVGPVEVSASLVRRPDGTIAIPMFTNLPDGSYEVWFTVEGCQSEYRHQPNFTSQGGLTGEGFSSRSTSGCVPVQ